MPTIQTTEESEAQFWPASGESLEQNGAGFILGAICLGARTLHQGVTKSLRETAFRAAHLATLFSTFDISHLRIAL